ncbi:hypothetical protein FRC07_011242 [Ceratobasidium sp. 392]|nr:hypothetical protein FRC07_011242 [Ceratobasidium sp. 392]
MSHDTSASSSLLPPPTPPSRPTRPRLSRGISSRRPQPPPVPPSLRDHPLLDVVANGSSSSASGSSSSTGSSANTTPTVPSSHPRSDSRRSSLSASSPPYRPADRIPLPSPTGLWTLPPRPSPPIGGPWSVPIGNESEPVGDAMGLLDTVPAGSTMSAASPSGYPWHAQGRPRAQGHDYTPVPHHGPGYALYPPTTSRRPAPHPHPHAHAQVPTSPSRQRHNHPVGTLHTHSPQPSPPVTPAAA